MCVSPFEVRQKLHTKPTETLSSSPTPSKETIPQWSLKHVQQNDVLPDV